MKRLFLLLTLMLASAFVVQGQVSSTVARRVRAGSSLPAACKATNPVDVFIRTGATAPGVYFCSATNTWSGPFSPSVSPTFTGTVVAPAINGGSAANDDITIQGTSNATRTTSYVNLQPNGGNVGIGTTSPARPLHVQADGDVVGSYQNSQVRISGATNPTRSLFLGLDNTNVVGLIQAFDVGIDTGRLSLNPFGGNVGVGDASPAALFTVGSGDLFQVSSAGGVLAPTYSTSTNCSDSAGAAACGSAAAGHFVIDAAATSVVVSTTAVTADSEIMITRDDSIGTRLSVTCNTQSGLVLGTPRVTARTAGVSFTVTIEVGPTTNPMCIGYKLTN